MGLLVSAVWKGMRTEDYENQPFLYNGSAWGEWVTEIWMDKWLPKRFYFSGLFALLTCCTVDSKDNEINWVKPKKLIKVAERLKKRLKRDTGLINTILQIYAKHSVGIESPRVEFSAALDGVIEVAKFVENAGGTQMSFRMEW